jgi:excisionase family DNA binding protein
MLQSVQGVRNERGLVLEEHAVLLRLEEVARMLQVSRSRAYQLAATGVLPVIRLGRRQLRVSKAALDGWVANLGADSQRPGEAARGGRG